MQQYIKDFMVSRGYTQFSGIKCEIPNCGLPANDIHHIESSYRGKRTHQKDGSDLIACCRNHHEKIHAKNNFKTREYLKSLVSQKLTGK